MGDTVISVSQVGALSHVPCAPISREDKSQRLLRYLTYDLLKLLSLKQLACDQNSRQLDGIRRGRRQTPRPSKDTHLSQYLSYFIIYLYLVRDYYRALPTHLLHQLT